MIPILTMLLAGFMTQQPQSMPRRHADPAPPSSANSPAPRPQAPPQAAAIESTMAAVTNVAQVVADVKAEADRFRTRAFNDPTGSVLESAAAFRTACERLTAAARTAPRMICRSCISGRGQPAFDRYRAYLPSLADLGGRCATRLRTKVTADVSPAILHQTAIDMSNMIVTGLRPYEQRIGAIRATLAPARPQRSPRRGAN
jgi:hypothetical protein